MSSTSCYWLFLPTLLLNMVSHISSTCSILQPSILVPLSCLSTPYSFQLSLLLSRFLELISCSFCLGIPQLLSADTHRTSPGVESQFSHHLVYSSVPSSPISAYFLHSPGLPSHFGPSLLSKVLVYCPPFFMVQQRFLIRVGIFCPIQLPSVIYLIR